MDDPRFSAMHSAPLFKKIRKEVYETQVDDRFKELLKEDRFSAGPGEKNSKKKDKIKKKPITEDEEQIKVNQEPKADNNKNQRQIQPVAKETRLEYLNKLARGEISGSSSESASSSNEDDSSSDDSDENASDNNFEEDSENGPLEIPGEEEIGEIDKPTNRLAIQNCEWNSVKAEDLMVIMQSFCAPGMVVKSVTVYPSDFGLEKMAEEALNGPPREIWGNSHSKNDDDNDSSSEYSSEESQSESENDESTFSKRTSNNQLGNKSKKAVKDADMDNVALRAYELSKLRYYFAIAVLDSARTAESLYQQLDGIEFEHSAMVFDMRYVPDEIKFSDRKVRDVCSGTVGPSYKPPDFVVQALQHSNVECTWDMDDHPDRSQKLTNISMWRQLNESDLQQYIASSNSDDSEIESKKKSNKKSQNMRKLLLGDGVSDEEANDDFFEQNSDASGDENNDDIGAMTYSYVPSEKDEDELKVARKKASDGVETPKEAAERRRLEKKAKKNKANDETASSIPTKEPATAAELAVVMRKGRGKSNTVSNSESEGEEDYDMHAIAKLERQKTKKAERKSKKGSSKVQMDEEKSSTDNFSVNTGDNRFFPLLQSSSNFGIDPTSSEFKPTEGMRKILNEQRRLREQQEEDDAEIGQNMKAIGNTDQPKAVKLSDVKPLVEKLKRKYNKM